MKKFFKTKFILVPLLIVFTLAIFIITFSVGLASSGKDSSGDKTVPYYKNIGTEFENNAKDYGGTNLKKMDDWATFIGDLVAQFLIFIGLVFFILMVWGGGKYLLAKGDKDEAKKGLDIIKAGVIGLIIVALAYSISAVIINLLSKG